ncbi:nuclear transport factor 2 family protein [Comamonas sp. NyZ500]|uniref:nuclear transport factor 2 family protein n=1 Tax=Comamonas sp. NyZ500 TaxID=2795732 RepID=UPI00192BA4DB|nr:nuclear transport factor 2 family protein [Comamonas sp. NyZ500]MBL5980589.1 nuclear transport factor 2 family protein [Comamonas sp. NyZ500]
MQSLLDEREILNQLARFVRMLDQRDWDALPNIFSEDVVFDYAEGVERKGLTQMRTRISGFLVNCGPTHHLLGSIIVEVQGNTALTKAYIQSRHQGMGDRSNLYFDANGEYIDHWERRDVGWRIVKRLAVSMFTEGDPRAMGSDQSIN